MNMLGNILDGFAGKKLIMRIFVYFGFLISGLNTFNAYNKDGYVWTIPVVILASTILIFEVGKAVCFIQYVENKHKEWLIMWICLMLLSVIGNICFFVDWGLQNDIAKLDYSDLKSKKTSLESQIEYKKADKQRIVGEKDLENSNVSKNEDTYNNTLKDYNDTIKDLQEQINVKDKELTDAIRKKYAKTPDIIKNQLAKLNKSLNETVTARSNLKKNDSNTIANKDTKIDEIDSEIEKLENEISELNIADSIPEKKVKGATALFVYLGIEWKFMELSLIIFMSFTFEIVLCMIYMHTKDMSWRDLARTVSPFPIRENTNNSNNSSEPESPRISKSKPTITIPSNPVSARSTKPSTNIIHDLSNSSIHH